MSDEMQRPAYGLRGYAGALESIILGLPGQVTVNGTPMSNEEGLSDLRRRFDVTDVLALRTGARRCDFECDACKAES